MVTRKKSAARITLRTVLEHVQHINQVLEGGMAKVRQDVELLHEDVRILRVDMRSMKRDMTGMERRLSNQIDSLDRRLDSLEVDEIPNLKKAVGAR